MRKDRERDPYLDIYDMTSRNNGSLSKKLKSVNFHITKRCNYDCIFCFARFNKVEEKRLSEYDAKFVIAELARVGTQKITFVGGEPTLVSYLPDLVIYAKDLGMTTMIVTNGTKITKSYLKKFDGKLDWVGLSIDSGKEGINKVLGRGNGKHVKQTYENVELLKRFNIKIKLNTVITDMTWDEDMSHLIQKINPLRWKVFKVLMIGGENDEAIDLSISNEKFDYFIKKHRHLNPISEHNEDMVDGYVMIDPLGGFFNNSNGVMSHGPSIVSVGIERAYEFSNFKISKFIYRGANYEW